MRRLLALAGLVAMALPVGSPPASAAAATCSVQANHFGTAPNIGFTAAVNCDPGTELLVCTAVAAVVYELFPGDPLLREVGIPSDPAVKAETGCAHSYSTDATSDTLPLIGSRHILATFTFAALGEPLNLVAGGDTQTLVCAPPEELVYVCVASSTSYSIP